MFSIEDYKQRLNTNAYKNFLVNNSKELQFQSAKRVLSIGAGDGDIDAHLVRHALPALTAYVALEPEADTLRLLEQRLRPLCSEVETHACGADTWEGPSEPVDVVFLSNVLYYLPDKAAFLQRCLSWLRPGGAVVAAVWCEDGCVWKRMFDTFSVSSVHDYWAGDVKKDIKTLNGVSRWEEFSFDMQFEAASVTEDCVNFTLNRKAPQDEMEKMLNFLKQSANSTAKFEYKNCVFVIFKD